MQCQNLSCTEIFTINISLGGMDSKRDFVGTKVGPSHIINNLYLSVR